MMNAVMQPLGILISAVILTLYIVVIFLLLRSSTGREHRLILFGAIAFLGGFALQFGAAYLRIVGILTLLAVVSRLGMIALLYGVVLFLRKLPPPSAVETSGSPPSVRAGS